MGNDNNLYAGIVMESRMKDRRRHWEYYNGGTMENGVRSGMRGLELIVDTEKKRGVVRKRRTAA